MKNADFHTLDVANACKRKLKIVFRNSGEMNGWFEAAGRRIAGITVPHGRKPIPPKTYKAMAAQLKIACEDLDGLLECPFGLEQYLDRLRAQGLIT